MAGCVICREKPLDFARGKRSGGLGCVLLWLVIVLFVLLNGFNVFEGFGRTGGVLFILTPVVGFLFAWSTARVVVRILRGFTEDKF